jgi:hypothetical protein
VPVLGMDAVGDFFPAGDVLFGEEPGSLGVPSSFFRDERCLSRASAGCIDTDTFHSVLTSVIRRPPSLARCW